MLFNSYGFVFLVLVAFLIYYLPIFRKLQSPVLIIASLFFYSANNPSLVLLLILSIGINIIFSYLVVHSKQKSRRIYAAIGIVANLSILAFFKYSPMFAQTFFDGPGSIGEFLLTIPLPIGISFYTFQGISLLVDSFKSNKEKEYIGLIPSSFPLHTMNTALFISFFPQLVAGPIVKAHDFLPQIEGKGFKEINWEYCFRNLTTGYFLKMVIADNLTDFTFWIEYPYFLENSSASLLVMLFGYSMQIFADFAGYSLIAIGIAGLFGYRLRDNFNFPYISKSFAEFWRRWHISLSTFLKEYLYIPLGGNKKGNVRTYVNLMIVMFLGGLWHGAAWSYAVWGSFHGVALAVERFLKDKIKIPDFLPGILKMFLVFVFVTIAWLLFKLPDFSHVILYVQSIGSNLHLNTKIIPVLCIICYGLPVIFYHAYYLYRKENASNKFSFMEPIFYGIMLFFIVTNSGSTNAFIYFQF